MVSQARTAILDCEDLLVVTVILVPRVTREILDREAYLAKKVNTVLQDHQVQLDLPDHLEILLTVMMQHLCLFF